MKRFGIYAVVLGALSASLGCGSDEKSPANSGATGGASSGGTNGAGAPSGGASSGGASSGGSGGSSGGASSGGANQAGTAGTAGTNGGGNGGGISTGFPGDVGIETHPDVIFADDFESYANSDGIWDRWDNFFQTDQTRIATEAENIYAGSQALEFTVPLMQDELSNAVDKYVMPELDVLYLRYYSKFQPPYDVVGSSHNGSSISAHYFEGNMATPGVPANGMNKFLVNLENWRGEEATASPGLLNVYVYHPEQRDVYGDHFFPTGLVMPNTSLLYDFGPDFVERPEIIPELDRWYCYEYMVQANTPDQRDGRITVWLDGVLVADFPNLRFRDIDSIKIDRFQLSFHIGSNPNGETKKWFDNVVAAKSYIGPMVMP